MTTEPTQDQLSKFVEREVIICASQMIATVFKEDNSEIMNEYQDDLYSLHVRDDIAQGVENHLHDVDQDEDTLKEYFSDLEMRSLRPSSILE